MTKQEIIRQTETFVKETLQTAEGGHDWFHIERVRNTALHIAKKEKADAFIVELGALLHDIADSKFHDGDENVGPEKARRFLSELGLDTATIEHIENIIRYVSFKTTLDKEKAAFHSKELDVIRDADRLDAIGAIGIARTFNYGGFKNRAIYDPEIRPDLEMDKATYKKSTAPTINHFYEKLLLLKDMMTTATGKAMAEGRHKFLETYLEQFFAEWEGKR